MDDFGILNPRFVQRVKDGLERSVGEVKRTAAPLLNEAERLFEEVFHAPANRPGTPLDGFDWQWVSDDEEALRERLERTIADLTMVQRHTIILDDPGSNTASFVVRVVLTDHTTWQARVPVTSVGQATEAELRLWALRLAGKVRP